MKWWDEHQDIKHHRHTDFKKATYKNAIYSLAGLYVLLLYLFEISDEDVRFESKYFYHTSASQALYVAGDGKLSDFE